MKKILLLFIGYFALYFAIAYGILFFLPGELIPSVLLGTIMAILAIEKRMYYGEKYR